MGKETLWLNFQQGGKSDFSEFYRKYRSLCLSLALGITRDEDRAKDIVQESFIAIYTQVREKGLQFDSRRHARDYLLKTVRHISLNFSTAQTRRVDIGPILDTLVHNADQEKSLIVKEELAVLRKALKQLSTKHRKILKLRFFEKMTLAEIAQKTGKPIPTIQYAEKRALEKLEKSKILREYFHKNGLSDSSNSCNI